MNKPKEKYWITYIKQRISKNKNFLGFISGPTGSGKSWTCLQIAQELDPNFSIDNVVFSGLELMNRVNSGDLKSGSVLIFEEVGVEVSSKNWYSTINKMLNYLIQTFRHRNFILLMNSPYMDFLDAGLRKLMHAEFQTLKIDLKNKEVHLKPHLIQYNGRKSKFYYKRLFVVTKEGTLPVSVWKVAKPSRKLIKAYEEKKTAYTDSLNKKIYEELTKDENKGKELTEIQQQVVDLLNKGYSIPEVCKIRQRTKEVIYSSLRAIKKKGYEVTKVLDSSKGGKGVYRYTVRVVK